MINRKALDYLSDWKSRRTRKPLVLRGARQVGKTKLAVDLFGKREFETVVEINFEANHDFADYFRLNNPEKTIPLLETATGQRIIDGKTLLFLDEIQAEPQIRPITVGLDSELCSRRPGAGCASWGTDGKSLALLDGWRTSRSRQCLCGHALAA